MAACTTCRILGLFAIEVLIHLVSGHEVVDLIRYLILVSVNARSVYAAYNSKRWSHPDKFLVDIKLLIVAIVDQVFVLLQGAFIVGDLYVEKVLLNTVGGQVVLNVFELLQCGVLARACGPVVLVDVALVVIVIVAASTA